MPPDVNNASPISAFDLLTILIVVLCPNKSHLVVLSFVRLRLLDGINYQRLEVNPQVILYPASKKWFSQGVIRLKY
jgi:hypothetical protein